MDQRSNQNFWNFIYSVLYLGVFLALGFLLYQGNGELPQDISLFEFILLSLASFRLVRLFVYDKVMLWFRDLFAGAEFGPRKTAHDLLHCPWCFGVWAATLVVFFFFLAPKMVLFPILVAAIAGVGSLLQIIANLIGWRAERNKLEALKLERDN